MVHLAATALRKRSFRLSNLIKSGIRRTMSCKRLNHLRILKHCKDVMKSECSIEDLMREFTPRNEIRKKYFGKTPSTRKMKTIIWIYRRLFWFWLICCVFMLCKKNKAHHLQLACCGYFQIFCCNFDCKNYFTSNFEFLIEPQHFFRLERQWRVLQEIKWFIVDPWNGICFYVVTI